MAEPNLARSRVPWLVAGALALVVAALAVLLVHVSSVRDDAEHPSPAPTSGPSGVPALTRSQQQAVTSGATEAANLVTYSRKHFATDFSRALNGATGALAKDVRGQKSRTLALMTKNKIDLKADVEHSAYEGTDGKGHVLALVTVNGYTVNDKGQTSSAKVQRLELTMIESGGKWRAANLTYIGIQ